MFRLIIYTILILFLQFVSLFSGDLKFPDRINENWVIQEPKRLFDGNRLFDHINGGAELFLEFGFVELTVCKYQFEDLNLDLEVYKMENSLAAFGIYLMKTGEEKPIKEIEARNTANLFQIVLTSGEYFILVNNFAGNKKAVPIMTDLSQRVIAQIEPEENEELFEYLPNENMIKNSQTLFRGQYGLQSIYTFGKGDILLLGGKIFGVGANYLSYESKMITQLVIPYPDSVLALKAYHNLISNLDSYLELTDRFDHSFVFKDYNQNYGHVSILNDQILIRLHLPSKPE